MTKRSKLRTPILTTPTTAHRQVEEAATVHGPTVTIAAARAVNARNDADVIQYGDEVNASFRSKRSESQNSSAVWVKTICQSVNAQPSFLLWRS